MKYTEKQVQFLVDHRPSMSWEDLRRAFNQTFQCRASKKALQELLSKRGRKKKPREEGRSHLIIPDCQIKPGVPLEHLHACVELIKARKPDVIINIGDFWDMESLSSYDTGKKAEGRRVQADIQAGNAAMDILVQGIRSIKEYSPKMVFTIGNHEERILRHLNANPHLIGFLSYDNLNLKDWEVYDFLKIVEIDGVFYSHYFPNPMSGRPFGGTIDNRINKLGFSFTMGHQQSLMYGRRDLNNGRAIHGLVAGAFYLHDEDYKGEQGNHHWRGVVYKHDVKDGDYSLEVINMDRLMKGKI